jgi:5-(carboxyamino)imidazole ribonucleotide synthase
MPARVPEQINSEVEALARTLADQIGLEGLMAIELFLTEDDGLLVNELALRTHNTGHLHTEASTTSQFEQHLRAVLDLPLGVTSPVAAAAAMVNVVGPQDGSDPASRLREALLVPGARVHVTVCAATPEGALALAREAADRLERNG